MDVLGKKARAIEASGTATNADIERLMARIDKLIANQMIVVSQMDPEEVLLSDYLIVNLKKGKSKTISAQVSPFCAVQTVKWSSSNTKVATVDAKGKVTAKGKGTAVITATSTKKSSVKKTCKIVVN